MTCAAKARCDGDLTDGKPGLAEETLGVMEPDGEIVPIERRVHMLLEEALELADRDTGERGKTSAGQGLFHMLLHRLDTFDRPTLGKPKRSKRVISCPLAPARTWLCRNHSLTAAARAVP